MKAFAFGDDVSNEICDFSQSVGIASDPAAAYVTNNVDDVDCASDVLLWKGRQGLYNLPGERLLTCRSTLSYLISSSDVGDRSVEIQASFDGGEWQTIRNLPTAACASTTAAIGAKTRSGTSDVTE